LILAQDERWRRALGMQVEWAGGQNTEDRRQIADETEDRKTICRLYNSEICHPFSVVRLPANGRRVSNAQKRTPER